MSKAKLQEYCQARRKELPKYKEKRKGGPDHNPIWISQVKLFDGSIHVSSPASSIKEAEKEAAEIAYQYLTSQGRKILTGPKAFGLKKFEQDPSSGTSSSSSSFELTIISEPGPSLSSDDLLLRSRKSENQLPPSRKNSTTSSRTPSPKAKKQIPIPGRQKLKISDPADNTDAVPSQKKNFPQLKGRKIAIFVDVENAPRSLFEFNEQIADNIDVFAVVPEKHLLVDKILPLIQIDSRIRLCKIPSSERDAADIGLIMAVTASLQDDLYEYYLILTGDHFGDVLANLICKFNNFNPTNGSYRFPDRKAECFRTLGQAITCLEKLVIE